MSMESHTARGLVPVVNSKPYCLPGTLESWHKPTTPENCWQPWEYLRSFFGDCGYELYRRDTWMNVPSLVPYNTSQDQGPNAIGVYGTGSYVPNCYLNVHGPVWPARNRDGLDVMIKAVSYRDEGVVEVEILKYLSSDPVKSEIDNPIVPVLEFLDYKGWIFAVQPRWSECTEPEFETLGEGLEFCVQVTKGVAFLHRHLIAHLDIAEENILMNFLGNEQTHTRKASYLRSWFRIRYGFIDFGQSRRFYAGKTPHLADVYTGRYTKAPELQLQVPYDPFAADVYQMGSMLLTMFWNILLLNPNFG